ncbi:hypothetical protein CCAX7_36190 [Capsulimonas corticalis]|uniref:Uncharacterized protein n=1 Tax=Capsulimonas corticalis TaxID=2219043 RepID=A0A402D6Y4_9BACT|nr:hypothetical protein [Capsulimonas corticalis]BDI31568.1 hypothetical protein CCAX7_36190 [Capsulimonas corticalis]
MTSHSPEMQPRGVKFRACTDAEIELLARRALRKGASLGSFEAQGAQGALLVLAIIGLICLFLAPPIKAVGVWLLVVAAALSLYIIGEIVLAFSGSVSAEMLNSEKVKLSGLHHGNCPICQRMIYINATKNPKDVECPRCLADLVFEDGCIAPK